MAKLNVSTFYPCDGCGRPVLWDDIMCPWCNTRQQIDRTTLRKCDNCKKEFDERNPYAIQMVNDKIGLRMDFCGLECKLEFFEELKVKEKE